MQGTINEKDYRQTLVKYWGEWPKAYAKQDTLLLDRILGKDFKMIDQAGNWYSKKDELEWIKKKCYPKRFLSLRNQKIRYLR